MTTPPGTFPGALSALLRRAPARPLVTFYDDATGERVELSVATYANWVAKTAALLQDEVGLERGSVVLVDLPTHWLGPVWLGAAWSLGLAVTDAASLAAEADLVVCGPEGVATHAANADLVPVVALSLRPLGGPFTEALPPGVTDYGSVVPGQPDSFAPYDPPGPDDAAWRDPGDATGQGTLLEEAGAAGIVTPGGRLLTDVNPCSRTGAVTLLAPVVLDASVVWVRHAHEAAWADRAGQERVTDELRAPGPAGG
ncbi:MAG: hypothetical protein QOF53_1371 [Nocardioidaceae bacterium]|jgi:uncharacterized protein (TIGR03089 family)|nr:hypothetical protein [Nocardioidaceae bacterium]